LDVHFISYARINQKCIRDLNVRAEATTLLEEHTGQMLHDAGFNNNILNVMSKA
jgi:hypothetical protein